ncbi:MAG: hypothetical protein Q9160_006637 [Pyrenula sp. 1 TL-2023]
MGEYRAEARELATRYRDLFLEEFDRQILHFLHERTDHLEAFAKKKAEEYVNGVSTQAPSPNTSKKLISCTQYNAWCRNYGDWRTRTLGPVNWNKELMQRMRTELRPQWMLLHTYIAGMFKDLSKDIEAEFLQLKSAIKACELPSELSDGVDRRIEHIRYTMGPLKQSFNKTIRSIRSKLTGGAANAYIREEMIASYRSASLQTGTGKMARQKSIVLNHVSDNAIIGNLANNADDDAREMVQNEMQDLEEQVLEVIEQIRADVELATSKSVKEEEKAKASAAAEMKGIQKRYDAVLRDLDRFLGEKQEDEAVEEITPEKFKMAMESTDGSEMVEV